MSGKRSGGLGVAMLRQALADMRSLDERKHCSARQFLLPSREAAERYRWVLAIASSEMGILQDNLDRGVRRLYCRLMLEWSLRRQGLSRVEIAAYMAADEAADGLADAGSAIGPEMRVQ